MMTKRRWPWRAGAGALLAILLVACDPGDPQPARPVLGAEGGSVAADGVEIQVPAGALDAPVEILIDASPADAPALPAGLTARGDIVALLPHGQAFAVPVSLRIPFAGAVALDDLRLYTAEPGGDWRVVDGAVVDGDALRAEVAHFSYFLAGEGAPVTNCGACVTRPEADGSYTCSQVYFEPSMAEAMRASFQANCVQDGANTYAEACPSGANPGCCTTGPAGGTMQVVCAYGCTAEVCGALPAQCEAAGGHWAKP